MQSESEYFEVNGHYMMDPQSDINERFAGEEIIPGDEPEDLEQAGAWPKYNATDESVVGKYVAVTDEEGEGASGWVESISEKRNILGIEGRYINFDWGMSMFAGPGDTIEEIEPPEDEKDGPNSPK